MQAGLALALLIAVLVIVGWLRQRALPQLLADESNEDLAYRRARLYDRLEPLVSCAECDGTGWKNLGRDWDGPPCAACGGTGATVWTDKKTEKP